MSIKYVSARNKFILPVAIFICVCFQFEQNPNMLMDIFESVMVLNPSD